MIAVVDYGMGNLRSVQKAFEKVGHPATVTRDPAEVAAADKLVLPGVGACGDAIDEIRRLGLEAVIKDSIAAGKPFLGICLGLQMLFDVSFEGGEHRGLGVLPGQVVRFELAPPFKVPHMGWSPLHVVRRPPILEGIAEGAHFYFVHSYYVAPADPNVVAATASYPEPFAAMVWRERLYACQFHPEKSQADGLRLLKNFAEFG